jgi:tRNA threonylcarbamoyladenosine biosynthesis protein TsaB
MKILAFEFSSAQRSVAIVQPGAATCEVVETGGFATHAIAMIDGALRASGLEREQIGIIAVGLGPGSYTGIRAAIAVAQGWQLARDIKLIGISTAEALAAQAQAEKITGHVSIVIDAQRDEFYLATYEIDAAQCRETAPLRIVSRAEVRARLDAGETIVGPELSAAFGAGTVLFPRAAALGTLALNRSHFVPGEQLEPIYLRQTQFVKAPPPRRFD